VRYAGTGCVAIDLPVDPVIPIDMFAMFTVGPSAGLFGFDVKEKSRKEMPVTPPKLLVPLPLESIPRRTASATFVLKFDIPSNTMSEEYPPNPEIQINGFEWSLVPPPEMAQIP